MRNSFKYLSVLTGFAAFLLTVVMLHTAAFASSGTLQYSKTIKVKEPCYIEVKARDHDYHTVDLLKKNRSLAGAFSTRPANSYTVRWLVSKGTYKLASSCKISKLKIKTKKIASMGSSKTVKWKLKAEPISGYSESDINKLCYKFKPSASGYFTFSCDDHADIELYNKKFERISGTFAADSGRDGYFTLEGKKTYYITFTYSSMSAKDQFSIKCKFQKRTNRAGRSKEKAAAIKQGKTIKALIYPKKGSACWIKYTVTGDENMSYGFYVDSKASSGSSIKTNTYLNGKLVATLTGGGNPLTMCYEDFSPGDTVLFEITAEEDFSGKYYNCSYIKFKRE